MILTLVLLLSQTIGPGTGWVSGKPLPSIEHKVPLKEANEILVSALAIQGMELDEKRMAENRQKAAEALNQKVQKLQIDSKMEGCKITLLPEVKWVCNKKVE